MLVAISQRQDKDKYNSFMDNLENNYVNYLEQFGVQLIAIPNSSKNVSSYFEKLPIEGVILTGGNSINPELYGGKPLEGSDVSKERDKTEKELLEIAIKKKLPVLGICRGMQFINVFFKGKLVNIKEKIGDKIKHVAANHTIEIVDEEAAKLLGNKFEVNSYHNQGIDPGALSTGLKSFALAGDGVIEGLYHPEYSIAGIEWHPERESPDEEVNEEIIEAFLNMELFWKK